MKEIITIIVFMILSFNARANDSSFYLKRTDGEQLIITTQALETMPIKIISTSTNFTDKSDFSGITFRDLLNKYKISGDTIRVFAWDDYSYSIPIKELLKYNVILAFKKNDQYISISDLGPYAIIYPRDSTPELKNLDVNARTVWQIKGMEVH